MAIPSHRIREKDWVHLSVSYTQRMVETLILHHLMPWIPSDKCKCSIAKLEVTEASTVLSHFSASWWLSGYVQISEYSICSSYGRVVLCCDGSEERGAVLYAAVSENESTV